MLKTTLNELHRRASARMVDFAGWDMPVLYTGIVEEHVHTRTAASCFDVSHMGRLEIRGPDADAVVQRAVTRNIGKLAVGRCGYAHVCNERGGIHDDVIVCRYPDCLLIVCNASNREKIVAHLKTLLAGKNAALLDKTLETCMIAVQGPAAMGIVTGSMPVKLPGDPNAVKRYGFLTGSVFGVSFSWFRTGYTGEDGFEIVVPAGVGPMVWDFFTAEGKDGKPRCKPAGLGARDTLRLEAGMPLYGHELGEEIDSISAGCQWCVDLTMNFVGAEALRKVAADGPKRKVVGLHLDGKRIARQGAPIVSGGRVVGEVTSGTQSPTLGRVIAMGFVDAPLCGVGTPLSVDLRGDHAPATVVTLPFYKRAS